MDFKLLGKELESWREAVANAKTPNPQGWTWYGYDILANISILDGLISKSTRKILADLDIQNVADIGCADGDLGYLLESVGHEVDLIDYPPTNWNGMKGVTLLRERLQLASRIHEVDLDSQFHLPRQEYGFVFLLGILYHLKNPFYVLERLAKHARCCAISTRVARYAGISGNPDELEIERLPVAYLLNPDECNNDATNFWIFSIEGLRRLVDRAGWEILDESRLGSEHSNPSDTERDQRAFLILRSRYF